MNITPEEQKMISQNSLLADLIPGYIERRKVDVSDLRKAFDEQNLFRIKAICHMVRGNAITFGFKGLHKICSEIEDSLDKSDLDAIPEKIGKLEIFINWL